MAEEERAAGEKRAKGLEMATDPGFGHCPTSQVIGHLQAKQSLCGNRHR